ncbi:Asp-tRNA(Asn)/Glu-tRNA(Gln) amidotransferase subunit GatA [Hydrogenivirga sp. 128-5-R1-1]|uniref:Asp-tRNA(Asn)/Glu-tRNA(Gln) amidotransferase subunit GatA n=1 Tax=Hydrogenivirga sp. 128-5-R1-1 TaxID=392423 RepID=UPI00015F188F|nr:Asp-tRNA(Asn)/Glu-tRNA(Gln) amidotransferase subunit GatA [Hydrogenivirga sp. 128-5-R1-1]EDP75437.1 glutamyl-tRNA (Gln) amidotransferase subunit A [Hydrogenivirga sp. 128-5-R1-1]
MFWQKGAKELVELMKKGELKPTEAVESFFKRFEDTEEKVKAFITPLYEEGIERAKELEKGKPEGKLFGLPVAVKDNILIKDGRTTCASRILENFVSPYDATVIERLRREGAIFVGKTNMDEFAMGSSTEHSAFFPTRNPWDRDRVPGGSSGGSAASVAVGSSPVALGSDTGGSIRQPASFCGVIGIKPTYGRVSRYGLVAFASSLDQIGVFARRTEDVALLLEVISGHDPKDSTSARVPVPEFGKELGKEIKGLRIGLPKEFFEFEVQDEVRERFQGFVDELESLGCEFVEVSLPHIKYAIPAYYIVAPSEASSNLARYDGVRYGHRAEKYRDLLEMYSKTRDEGFGAEVKRRIMLGTFALSAGYYDAYYLKAQKVRRLIYDDFMKAFERVDLIASPTTPTLPFKLGERLENPIEMYLSDVLTVPVNLAGLPGISVPIGMAQGLPVGGQLIGKPWDEATLLRVSYAWETVSKHYELFPEI